MLADNVEQNQVSMDCPVCNTCKSVVAVVKDKVPAYMDMIKAVCKSCGAPENVKKCEKLIDNIVSDFQKFTPEQVCERMHLCKKSSLAGKLGL